MYPDTDTPPIPVTDEVVERVRASLPETPWARGDRYGVLGLTPAAAHRLAASPWADLFDHAAPPAGDLARRLAASLAKRIPYHHRAGRRVPSGAGAVLRAALKRLAAEESRPEALDRIVDAAVAKPGATLQEILAPFAPPPAPDVDALVGDAAARSRKRSAPRSRAPCASTDSLASTRMASPETPTRT